MKKIIVFEGADGTWKTTLSKMLAEKLGYNYIKFPNENTAGGRYAREVINREMEFDSILYQISQNTDKRCTFRDLTDGNYIFDRYKLSEIVYGYANGLTEEEIMDLADKLPDPDITFLMVGKSYKLDDDIFGNPEYQEKVKELFLREAKKAGGRVELINNEKSIEAVFNEILGKLGGII